MSSKILKILCISIIVFSCSKKEKIVSTPDLSKKSYETYNIAIEAMNEGDYFFAANKFKEAETLIPVIEDAAKSLIMSAYCHYLINFYDEMQSTLNLFISKYPANEYIPYANYLLILSNYEKITDEKKDIAPLIKTKNKINEFFKSFPDSEYSLDLRFKLDLINNQLAAKELFVAKYYIQTKKWIPAINRLQNITKNYEKTIFVEEALHRLVEVYFEIGLEDEAQKTAALLGYNYNSSKWYEQSYKILNKEYKIKKPEVDKKKELGLIKRTIKRILE